MLPPLSPFLLLEEVTVIVSAEALARACAESFSTTELIDAFFAGFAKLLAPLPVWLAVELDDDDCEEDVGVDDDDDKEVD